VIEVQADEKNAGNVNKQLNFKNYSLASPQK